MKRTLNHARWRLRWHLRQRRPRRPLATAIDLATTAAHGLLAATAIIFVIGG